MQIALTGTEEEQGNISLFFIRVFYKFASVKPMNKNVPDYNKISYC